jgi:hypothetical protein
MQLSWLASATIVITLLVGCGGQLDELGDEEATEDDALSTAGLCGQGYSFSAHYPIKVAETDVHYGQIRVYYCQETARQCAIAVGNDRTLGVARLKAAKIRLTGDEAWNDVDSGPYSSYAGPVYSRRHTGNRCVFVEGTMTDARGRTVRSGHRHCIGTGI